MHIVVIFSYELNFSAGVRLELLNGVVADVYAGVGAGDCPDVDLVGFILTRVVTEIVGE